MISVKAILSLCALTGAYGLEPVGEAAKVGTPARDMYLGLPFAVGLIPRYTRYATAVIGAFFRIPHIFLMRCGAQIAPAIIMPNPVYVVGNLNWILSSHVQEGESVSKVHGSTDKNSEVVAVCGSSRSGSVRPSKYASIRAVVQDRFKIRLRKFHSCLLSYGIRDWVLQHPVPIL